MYIYSEIQQDMVTVIDVCVWLKGNEHVHTPEIHLNTTIYDDDWYPAFNRYLKERNIIYLTEYIDVAHTYGTLISLTGEEGLIKVVEEYERIQKCDIRRINKDHFTDPKICQAIQELGRLMVDNFNKWRQHNGRANPQHTAYTGATSKS